jgi:S-adenosyl-L-methionine hydrolase (adenosine-forming)
MRITLLTDFGTADGYVAAMKGAIAQIAPSVLVDDASHAVAPGDITAAAFALRRYWRLYPEGTVHIAVIDPGVGSDRRAIAGVADGRFFVGPDNGVFTFVLKDAQKSRVFTISEQFVRESVSRTFHGRDVFAPVAAQLARGRKLDDIGEVLSHPLMINMPSPIATESSVRGEIVHIDRFGNLVSNIPSKLLQLGHVAHMSDRDIPVVETYADAKSGELVALINSDGVVEIAVRDGSAAQTLSVERGAPVELNS